MGGKIVARGPDDPHRCAPLGDRVRTYRLPATPTSTAETWPVHTVTYAQPGDVYQCDCGKAWVACAEAARDMGVWGRGGYRAERGYDWRRERWWERRRRTRRQIGESA